MLGGRDSPVVNEAICIHFISHFLLRLHFKKVAATAQDLCLLIFIIKLLSAQHTFVTAFPRGQ